MGTGKDVNFNNDGEKFTIELDSLGHLNFLANTGRDLRMSILDDDNEVIVDGTVTIGGSGEFGGLQLKASDGDNTIFLGSTANQANILMGGGGHDGFVKIKDADGRVAIDMRGDTGFLGVGTSGNDGAVNVNDSAGKPYISMGSGQLNVNVDGLPTIKLDGTLATVTVGSSTARGIIDVCDGTGAVTIKLSGDGGLIEYDQIQQDTTPDGKFPVQVAHQPVEGALARVRALQAIRYRASRIDGTEVPRIGLRGDEVEQVCPELVATVGEGRTGVNYSRLTALLVEAVKEQQLLIVGLEERLTRLETSVAA